MLTQVRCRWLNGQEQKVSVADCRACALTGKNPCTFPLPILLKVTSDRDPAVVQQSATMFSGCAREHAIKAHSSWSIDPERAYTRAYGSVFHEEADIIVSLAQDPLIETEHRYSRPYTLPDGRTAIVTAQLDVLYKVGQNTYTIQDYKVVDSVSDSALNRKVSHYVPQFSIQRWILAGHGMEVTRVDLHFLTQKKPRKINLFPDGDAAIPFASLMTLEETELYFDERLPALVDGLSGVALPGPLTSPSEWWRCRYCDVQDECRQLWGSELPAFR